jgi:beta-galactosidase
MERIPLMKDWLFSKIGEEQSQFIDLPHDAMLHEERTIAAPGINSSAYFPGGEYVYVKSFLAPAEWKNKTVYLHFEGVYHHPEVFINGLKDAGWDNGYRDFAFEISEKLIFGGHNEIKVLVHNADQPNSRWYSGSGIYRPVYLEVLPEKHLFLHGVRIETLSYLEKKIRVHLSSNGNGPFKIDIQDGQEVLAHQEGILDHETNVEFTLPSAKLWNPQEPQLYQCHVLYGEDERLEKFGIRMIEADAQMGFRLNGVTTLLNGACVHGDNGLLGACSYPEAERRKVRLLKENGYNAVRCAHNPCSIAFLEACDEEGLFVMDEYADMWFMHKSKYDYATYLPHQWEQDLTAMIEKDFNHPSVVMISLGNEVGESAKKEGVALCQKMSDFVHQNGNHWLTTAGINVFFNLLSSLGLGVYSDKKADKKASVGSEFFNKLAGLLGDETMKRGAALPSVDRRIRGVYSTLDVAGYNYGILRYKKDHKKYPHRVILGSETFCKDAALYLDMAKKNPAIIGDFVWSGMDYLGEAGVGAWEYEEYAKDFRPTLGWITAGSGRIDLNGNPLGEALYTRVVYGLSPLEVAVRPLMAKKDHSPSAWKMSDALPSWSFEGREGRKATVEVYARSSRVALFLNGKKVKEKKCDKSGRTLFVLPYEPGELKAVSYDEKQEEIASKSLVSAQKETVLSLQSERKDVSSDSLVYIGLAFTDNSGVLKPLVKGRISLKVEGGRLLGFGSAAPYNEESYLGTSCTTYYGQALAIILADGTKELEVRSSSSFGEKTLLLPIKKRISL